MTRSPPDVDTAQPARQDIVPAARAIQRRPPTAVSVGAHQHWAQVEWQKLWLATQRSEWRSLAIVPAGEMPVDFTLDVAIALMRTGAQHIATPLRIADATSVPLANLSEFMAEFQAVVRAGDRVLLALSPLRDSATTVTLAHAADRALLCVPLGLSKVSDAKQAIEEIGAERFIGSVTFRT